MSLNPASDDSLLRRLLALETQPDPVFADGVRTLVGADALVLLASTTAGSLGAVRGSGVPADVESAVLGARVDLAAHALVAADGGFHLDTAPLRATPLAQFFPDATWCLVGVGPGAAYGALWFGAGPPPAPVLADGLLADQLLRRLGDRMGGTRAGLQTATEALTRLSHEFKTPLVSIKGYAELILDQDDGTLDPRLRQWVTRIAGGANRLAALFRKTTAEARAGAGDAYETRPVDAREWVRRGVEETAALAGARTLEWQWRADPELPWIQADPEAAQDLLLELLQNAARSTPDGGRIEVEAAAVHRNLRRGVQVSVRDSGVGFPAGAAGESLFGRFATWAPVLSHHSGEFEFGAAGLGLGLGLARGVARGHGGELWAEGTGRDERRLPGSVFRVWLPACDPQEGEEGAGLGPGRILLLEPDPEPRQILAAALGESYQVVCVVSATAAREAWAAGEWAGCILEPRVPGGGAGLVRDLRTQPETGRAAILTYSTASSGAETAAWRAAGADSCVAKPARTRVLLQRLKTVRNRRTRR